MNAIHLQAESYFNTLRDLSPDVKLELIVKLSNSVKKDVNAKKSICDFRGERNSTQANKMLDELYGSWKSEKTADEIINEIKQARTPNKDRVKL